LLRREQSGAAAACRARRAYDDCMTGIAWNSRNGIGVRCACNRRRTGACRRPAGQQGSRQRAAIGEQFGDVTNAGPKLHPRPVKQMPGRSSSPHRTPLLTTMGCVHVAEDILPGGTCTSPAAPHACSARSTPVPAPLARRTPFLEGPDCRIVNVRRNRP
jgi:hypothetical protein